MSCGVIIAAAGKGKRMGADINKQFILLNNKPILVHTLEKFQDISWINEIVVVVHPEEVELVQELIQKNNLSVTAIVPGGFERQDSIKRGLEYIKSEWVMVHDGARPFISSYKLDELYLNVKTKDAVILGVPVKDTVKIADGSGIIKDTPDRNSLWAIQTPQAFRASILRDAFDNAVKDGFIGTDDSSLVERIGVKVHVIDGDYNNIKITTQDDLIHAKLILEHWGGKNV